MSLTSNLRDLVVNSPRCHQVYYKNIWQAQNFPFLSQTLFYENGTLYNQTLILNENLEVDKTLLLEQGLPFYAATWVVQLLTTNLGMAATFTYVTELMQNRLHD